MFDQVKGKWNKQGENSEIAGADEPIRQAVPRASDKIHGPTMIGPSIRIKGDLTGDENLIVEGQVEGVIHLEKNDLTVGTSGRIKANIFAKGIIVEGQVEGDIVGKEKVIIRHTGNMRGNIVAPRVTLEDGAMFKGSIEMEPEARRVPEAESAKQGQNKGSVSDVVAVPVTSAKG